MIGNAWPAHEPELPRDDGERPRLSAVPEAAAPPGAHPEVAPAGKANFAKLALAALGVVYGDIGTSPLYAFRECFDASHGLPLSTENVLGVLSLIFWALTSVVSVKYLSFILRADNRGEGGIMALLALLIPQLRLFSRPVLLVAVGLFGAALLYGDGIITPAISVLSAVEGLHVATPALEHFIVPITALILIVLFSMQHRGTERIGNVFGPIMLLWFSAIAAAGVPAILSNPGVLSAINPLHALTFFGRNGIVGFSVLGAVVLAITGAEALYADLGHFGRRPIRLGWFALVFPALMLNYLGQGAIVLRQGEPALANPFYALTTGWTLYPMIALATLATVIASQALISGAYSLTQQAMQLGYLPRTLISHTSQQTRGQIYIARVNQFLMIGSVALVLIFQRSTNLAAAYGIAVTGTMMITSILYYFVVRKIWNWKLAAAGSLAAAFLLVDGAFFFANLRKLFEGGWIPILIATALFLVMRTWKRGRAALAQALVSDAIPIDRFLAGLPRKKPTRVHGTAVFMTVNPDVAPPVLLRHVRHNHMLHERVILMTIVTDNRPVTDDADRIRITEKPHGFLQIKARYGYMESPDMSEILIYCLGKGLPLDINDLSFYLGRETFLTTGSSTMRIWEKRLFILLTRNARPPSDYFHLPPDQVIELGSQVAI